MRDDSNPLIPFTLLAKPMKPYIYSRLQVYEVQLTNNL